MKERMPLWPLAALSLIIVGAGMHAHNLSVQQHEAWEAHKAEVYQSYVLDAHQEADLHNDARIIYLTARYNDAKAAQATALEAANAAVASAKGKVDAKELTDALPGLSLVGDTQLMQESAATLTTMAADLTEKVKAYDAEQARLKAEREAAARAAAEEAARQAEADTWTDYSDESSDYEDGQPAPEQSSGVDYTLYVYASGQDQGLVDACAGAVAWWGEGFVEHWSCGGSSFPEWAGAIVDIPGYGTYRVTGVLGGLDFNDPSTYWIPGGAFYQTCLNGDSSNTIFIGLERL